VAGIGGSSVPSGDDIAASLLQLLKGIAERIKYTPKEATTLSPTTEMAYQEAEELRRSRHE
jgi:hypothetical protein